MARLISFLNCFKPLQASDGVAGQEITGPVGCLNTICFFTLTSTKPYSAASALYSLDALFMGPVRNQVLDSPVILINRTIVE